MLRFLLLALAQETTKPKEDGSGVILCENEAISVGRNKQKRNHTDFVVFLTTRNIDFLQNPWGWFPGQGLTKNQK